MNRSVHFAIGLIAGLLLSCAHGYRHYAPSMPDECYDKGTLLAKDPKDDKPMKICKPDDSNKFKCVMQELDVFLAKDTALKNCKVSLEECQKRCAL